MKNIINMLFKINKKEPIFQDHNKYYCSSYDKIRTIIFGLNETSKQEHFEVAEKMLSQFEVIYPLRKTMLSSLKRDFKEKYDNFRMTFI